MIRFALYLHNHQPVGNFDHVFEYAYTNSYLPLLKALMNHEHVKFGIHNSGPLLEWISKRHPEYIEILREVVKRGQAEILGSAYGEPILSLIPKQDAIEQIKYFNDYIYKIFEFQPRGLWLTERVWEPGLISTLIDAGIEYTLLDDTVFLYAGLGENELYSYYVTEDDGRILKIFPISMKLRYLIPFQSTDKTINFLREEENKRNGVLKTLGDDGEKFGVWPGTNDWVYRQGWLEKFLGHLETEPWIETALLHKIANEPPVGRVYLPAASYEEMGGWALPPDVSMAYDEMKKSIDEKYYHLIPGGYFKNFLRKYPEANLMHKRMLYVSKNIGVNLNAKLPLWRGQCSCVYWHGIFGGLYLPHLRTAVYENLIEADNVNIKKELRGYDFDADGAEEIVFSNQDFFFVLKPKSASFIELDDRNKKINVLNYLGRREERYHRKLPKATENKEIRSIHEIFQSKEQNLTSYLIYDRYERGFGLDHILDNKPGIEDFRRNEKMGKIVEYPSYEILDREYFNIKFSGAIEKMIEISKNNNHLIQIKYDGNINLFGVEFSLGIFGSKILLDDNKNLFEPWQIDDLEKFTIAVDNDSTIKFSANEKFSLLSYPIETVSSSESGFERNFQGFTLLLIFTKLPTIWIEL